MHATVMFFEKRFQTVGYWIFWGWERKPFEINTNTHYLKKKVNKKY